MDPVAGSGDRSYIAAAGNNSGIGRRSSKQTTTQDNLPGHITPPSDCGYGLSTEHLSKKHYCKLVPGEAEKVYIPRVTEHQIKPELTFFSVIFSFIE